MILLFSAAGATDTIQFQLAGNVHDICRDSGFSLLSPEVTWNPSGTQATITIAKPNNPSEILEFRIFEEKGKFNIVVRRGKKAPGEFSFDSQIRNAIIKSPNDISSVVLRQSDLYTDWIASANLKLAQGCEIVATQL